jgi:hypothetical protein
MLLLAAIAPAQAQSGARRRAPPAPPEAPPPPAILAAPTPPAPTVPPEPPLTLPQGMVGLPQGGWRLRFSGESPVISSAALQATLAELGRRLGTRPLGRVMLAAQASGPVNDVSAARRITLARALAVKQALAAGGLAETRIDIRALGRIAEAEDAVDILPSEASSSARQPR